MGKNSYPSTAFDGPLMLHIKNKIVRDHGLQDAGNMYELLVNNRIVNLELPIIKVFERVWLPALRQPDGPAGSLLADLMMQSGIASAGDGEDVEPDEIERAAALIPMIVTYRLTGLDGEATEDVVDSLPDEDAQRKNPEVLLFLFYFLLLMFRWRSHFIVMFVMRLIRRSLR
jgi:E3 ubiquitin-protein ligase UBR4